IAELNGSSRRLDAKLASAIADAAEELWPEPESEALDAAAARLRMWFARADSLAKHYSRRLTWHLVTLFVLVGIAIASLELYAHVYDHSPRLLLGYPMLLVV